MVSLLFVSRHACMLQFYKIYMHSRLLPTVLQLNHYLLRLVSLRYSRYLQPDITAISYIFMQSLNCFYKLFALIKQTYSGYKVLVKSPEVRNQISLNTNSEHKYR